MGIKNIMGARKILMVASGGGKREALYKMVAGKIEPGLPASILQLHNDVTVVADADALGLILEKAPALVDERP
jgi:glucosamine-6-phosphate deaminase